MYIIKALLFYTALIYFLMAFFLYIAQELIIFPRLLSSKLSRRLQDDNRPPPGIYSFFADTEDGEKLEVWTNHKEGERPKMAGIIFHGNGETVETQNFIGFFKQAGIPSFTFDYRGTGLSSGWPSEKGLYLDAEAVYREVIRRTGLDAKQIVVLGNSLGSGPASYLANKIKPAGLILLCGYANLRLLASEDPFYRFFRFVTRYELPTEEYIRDVGDGFIILAHGGRDEVIPYHHLGRIMKNLPKGNKVAVIDAPHSTHNDLYDTIEKDLVKKVKEFAAL